MALTDTIPSKALDVLQKNMQNVDEMTNYPPESFENRPAPNGNENTYTYAGINDYFSLLYSVGDTLVSGSISDIDWVYAGKFASGVDITEPQQVLRYNGVIYRTSETLPYTTDADTPDLDSGTWLALRTSPDEIPAPDVFLPLNSANFVDTLSGDYTFSRASTAQTINKSGYFVDVANDEPAITKDGVSIFDTVTNLIQYSEDIEYLNGNWTRSHQNVGETGATKNYNNVNLNEIDTQNTGAVASLFQVCNVSSGSVSAACFCAAGTSEYFRVLINYMVSGVFFSSEQVVIESSTLTTSATTANFTVINYNDYILIKYTAEYPDPSIDQVALYITPACGPTGPGNAYTGSAYFGGAQITETPYPAPYIKTESVAVTRAGDLLRFPIMDNLPVTGGAWTISATCALLDSGYAWQISALPSNSTVILRRGGTGTIQFYYDKSDGSDRLTSSSGVDEGRHIFTCVYQPDYGMLLYMDGVFLSENTTDPNDVCEFYTLGNLAIGSTNAGNVDINNEIKDFKIWHRALTAEQIAQLGSAE